MKLLKKSIFLLLVGVLVLTSCKEKANLQLNAIPADAVFVVAVENQKMIQKGGLNNPSDYKLFQKAQEEMSSEMNPESKKIFDEFLKNPKSSGLDVEKTYIYGSVMEDGMYFVVNFKMDSQSTFEKKIKKLFEAEDETLQIVEEEGIKLILDDDKLRLAWNDDLLLLFGGNISSLDYKSFFNLPSDKNILSVADFVTFQKDSYDIGLWMAYGDLFSLFDKLSTGFNMPAYLDEFKDAYFHGYVNFNNGEINATGRMSPESKVEDFMKKYPIIKKNINTALLEDFPEKSYFLSSISVDMAEYLKVVTEQFSQMGQMPGMDTYLEMLNDPTVKTVLDILEGDLVFSLYNFAQGPLPVPLMGLSFTLKNEGDFERLLSLFPGDMLTKNGDYYVMSTPMMVGIYVGYKDKRVFITDDADAIASFVGKGFSPNLKSSAQANELKSSPALLHMNLDLETYPENIRALITGYATSEIKAGLKFLEPMKDISYYATAKNEVVFSLKFKDSKQNSLKTLMQSIDELAISQMR